MNEFELIDAILKVLGETAVGSVLGPGDDAAALEPPAGELLVSSIDTLVGGVHFPEAAPAELVGYRALMVSLSDLAAMSATPAQALVALTLGEADQGWALKLAAGMREAALATGVAILGGNLARGPRSITVSVHGFCPAELLLRRDGARAGDDVFVTGSLGAAATAVAEERLGDPDDPLTRRYFRPRARFDAGLALRGIASAAIDVSDGLLQDLAHLCTASGVGAALRSEWIPVADGATLENALHGGDDYELLFAATRVPTGLATWRIGTLTAEPGIRLDDRLVDPQGYQHFR
jgi:thiamine-monophosphate kinase